jgi:predicted  nucleic acid-binding Zn-ribbon protein
MDTNILLDILSGVVIPLTVYAFILNGRIVKLETHIEVEKQKQTSDRLVRLETEVKAEKEFFKNHIVSYNDNMKTLFTKLDELKDEVHKAFYNK